MMSEPVSVRIVEWIASIEIVDNKEYLAKIVPRNRDGNTVVNFFDRKEQLQAQRQLQRQHFGKGLTKFPADCVGYLHP